MQVTIRTESHNPKRTVIKIIDWNNSSDRKWLANHTHWAMMNKVEIKLRPTDDYDRTIHGIASHGGFGDSTVAV